MADPARVLVDVGDSPYGGCLRRRGWLAVVRDAPARADDDDAAARVGADDAAARTDADDGAGVSAQPDVDALEDLAEEIATLAAHIHAATQRFLLLIAEFDRLRGWEVPGYPSCAHWLHARTGIDLGTAREKVRTARALEGLPLTSAAMARGELSFSKVRAITRVATGDDEAELLELAQGATTAQLERIVRAWKKRSRKDEAEWERERHDSRTFSVFPGDDGMYVVKGVLPPEVGAVLMRAVEAASDALFREKRVPGLGDQTHREAAQRRADAVGLLAERALAAGFGGAAADDGGSAEDGGPAEGGCTCASRTVPVSGSSAERYQVILHVEPATLSGDVEPGRSELEDGMRVSAETSRRLACDSGVVRVGHGEDGSILSVGRKTRTIPPALRRALEVRDRGCRFPGCGLRFADAHHLKHWADGGETSLDNCILLCRHHHRLVHEGGWRVAWWNGRPAFHSPRGEICWDGRWQPACLPADPVAALVEENRRRGADPDGWTAGARWEHGIPNEVWLRAREAL
jgi:hypothetical protein